ncbi:hypothetical protein RvY_01007-1 [Ramazzottius varieornatus]|uniref:Uncharacterized protein n=1 Tax=Ramazzottius varieornatus TaxID=947166 RepID=A0A1D1UFP6_RAMVA|nr:hypothetical protein RvY_01007-1 [Ramazzottius varieornatus]
MEEPSSEIARTAIRLGRILTRYFESDLPGSWVCSRSLVFLIESDDSYGSTARDPTRGQFHLTSILRYDVNFAFGAF